MSFDLSAELLRLQSEHRVRPDDAACANRLGCLLVAAGRHGEAVDVLGPVLTNQPGFTEARINLAVALAGAGRPDDALTTFAPLLAPPPGDAPDEAHSSGGMGDTAGMCGMGAQALLETLLQQGHADAAVRLIDAAAVHADIIPPLHALLKHRQDALPGRAELPCRLARLDKQAGDLASAERALRLALTRDASHLPAWRELGWLLAETGRAAEAVDCFRQIVQRAPEDWQAWNDGACCLRRPGTTDAATREAAEWMARAVAQQPERASLHANLALIRFDLHDYAAAQAALDRALALDPHHAEALHTQSLLASAQGRHAKAERLAHAALQHRPDYPQARLSLALAALMQGRWREGFAAYEARWAGSDRADVQAMPTLGRPQWHAAPWRPALPGSRIAILGEQGYGDQLQFVRFLPLLRETFQHIDLLAAPALHRLLHHSLASDHLSVHASPATLPRHLIDFELPLMSLPLALGLDSDILSKLATPYLRASESGRQHWRTWLAAHTAEQGVRKRIGIAWSGKPTLAKDALRSLPPESFAALRREGIAFVAVQAVAPDDVARHAPWLATPITPAMDFADTAALLAELDLVICVDTAVAHLAGALGRPVWLLNRLGSEWRWMDNREDSPWYPTMRIFNQRCFRDWSSTLDDVRQAMDVWLSHT